MTEKEEVEFIKAAIRRAIDSSVPYIVNYGAFMISDKSWKELVDIIHPEMKKLDEMFEKINKGIKISRAEIDDWMSSF